MLMISYKVQPKVYILQPPWIPHHNIKAHLLKVCIVKFWYNMTRFKYSDNCYFHQTWWRGVGPWRFVSFDLKPYTFWKTMPMPLIVCCDTRPKRATSQHPLSCRFQTSTPVERLQKQHRASTLYPRLLLNVFELLRTCIYSTLFSTRSLIFKFSIHKMKIYRPYLSL